MFFALFTVGIGALVFQRPDWDGMVFLALVLGIMYLPLKNALDFHNVYIVDESTFVLKHLFYTRCIAAGNVRGVRNGLLPTSYFLVTPQRDFYFSVIDDLRTVATELTSLQTGTTLKALNQKVWQMQQVEV